MNNSNRNNVPYYLLTSYGNTQRDIQLEEEEEEEEKEKEEEEEEEEEL